MSDRAVDGGQCTLNLFPKHQNRAPNYPAINLCWYHIPAPPQWPFETPPVPSNRNYSTLNRGTLEAASRQTRALGWQVLKFLQQGAFQVVPEDFDGSAGGHAVVFGRAGRSNADKCIPCIMAQLCMRSYCSMECVLM